ncbi:hypothetical protein O159_03100 [Leifsonia xyli subsp. cynodontis DSM 46306]|uniref:Chromosome condensation regulator RCC1 n=1 Tax=Leifsonia xyli subsp. cynodontis DSM 46306 TaxID=1389489 RepID=U3PAM2_LEIXC|nr:hypothetical protein [Leifsonia xyli]AGW40533.1 hypothetical protein O159_03100 [Leifsonia xyli subsp. cynodontis DSM 46306]
MTRSSSARTARRAAFAAAGLCAALALAATTASTTAGFTDSTFASSALTTMTPSLTIAPVPSNQTFGSTLYLNAAGEVYLAGDRTTGDGAGGLSTAASATPTKVAFPADVHIVDAIGSTNDFTYAGRDTTAYIALDSTGGVWTWGRPFNSTAYLGRGSLSATDAAKPGKVTRTNSGKPLPAIASVRRIENQFLALDNDGTLWAWGWGGENLPIVSSAKGSYSYPIKANSTTMTHGYWTSCETGANALGDVRWRSIWSGKNVDGAVAQNGLVYTWGWENTDGLTPTVSSDTCPTVNEGLNRVLFQNYPGIYKTAAGESYDERALTTEAARHQRFLDIVANTKNATVCTGVNTGIVTDDSGCPVRQLAFHAASMHLLTKDGSLYSVSLRRIGDGYFDAQGWLRSLLGRTASEDSTRPDYAYRPQRVSFAGTSATVSSLSSGIGHVTAVLSDGTVWGWGINRYCQAIGGRGPSGSGACDVLGANDKVIQPTKVVGLDKVRAASVSASACATWVTGTDGSIHTWGGGRLSGSSFYVCGDNGAYGSTSYDFTEVSPDAPFANPITGVSVGTTRILKGSAP